MSLQREFTETICSFTAQESHLKPQQGHCQDRSIIIDVLISLAISIINVFPASDR